MIKIEKIDTYLVDLPTIRPHILSMTTISRQTLAVVEIHCDDGSTGIGEGTTIGGLAYGPESPEGIKLAIDTYFAPLLAGCDADRPAAAMALLDRHIVGNHFAKNAIETALLDALGRRLGLSLSMLLGGRVRDSVPVLWTLASGDTGRDIDEAAEMVARRRHNAFKLKIGKRPVAEDVAHVAAIKRALGDAVSIRVDINQAWDEPTARDGIARLADAGADLVEQPVPAWNRGAMRRLTATAQIPIMADEALRGPADGFDFAAQAAAHIFSIKPAQSGGLFAAGKLAAIAGAAGVAVYGGTMLEAGIGTAAAAHLCATLPRLEWGTELFGPLLLTEEILTTPLAYHDFALDVPDAPGLGIRLDPDKIARFRRDRTRSAPLSVPAIAKA